MNLDKSLPTNHSEGAKKSPDQIPLPEDTDDDIRSTASEENTAGIGGILLETAKSRGGVENAQKDTTLPCGCKKGGRNLVVCIDGTGNQFGRKNSNVVELYSLLLKDDKQQTWYNSGIGTFAKPSHVFEYYKQRLWSMWDMAVAWNPERIVCGAYRWLSDNYRPGDRIFIFGFSRGAYQARVVSAMIDRVGLLHKGNEMQIPFAYDLYRHRSKKEKAERHSGPSNSKSGGGTATESNTPEEPTVWENFKATFCHKDAKVHFVGAWDTVSSIGIVRTPGLLPGTTEGMKHVCYFRHSLALDERRVKFLPEYAFGGISDDPNPSTDTKTKRKGPPQVKEVWFAGTHSDIGGGNVENPHMLRSVPPLRWMASEAKDAGLRIKGFTNDFLAIEEIEVVESMTRLWWILEKLPVKQLTYDDPDSTTRRLHNGRGRKVCVGQKIHVSVLQTKNGYSPKAEVSMLGTDDDLRSKILDCLTTADDFCQHLELNDYERVRILVMQAALARRDGAQSQLVPMKGVPVQGPMEEEGVDWQLDLVDVKGTLFNVFIDMLKATNFLELKLDSKFLDTVIRNIGNTPVQRVQWRRYEDSDFISHMLRTPANDPDVNVDSRNRAVSNSDRLLANTFLRKFTVPIIATDAGALYCVIFSGDGKRLLSGGEGGTMRIWDAETGEAQGQIETGMEWIMSLAASPGNSEFCVVGGYHPDAGNNLQVRETKENGAPMVTFDDNDGAVLSVGLFGENIVSASDDGSVRLWKRADGTVVKKFEAPSQSVVFSSDGTKVVLSALSQGIKVVEVNTGETELITSDIDTYVVCVAADGNRIAGSSDPIIRIWDVDSKEPKQVAVLEGHTDTVWSVCFAMNSAGRQFIVSGSDDKTVKVWDAKTYRWRKDLEGHSAGVTSVAFSPDAKRIASADRDGTIMVWECDSF